MNAETKQTELEATNQKNAIIFDLEEAIEYFVKIRNQDIWTKIRKEKKITIGENHFQRYDVAFADRSSGYLFEIFEVNKQTGTVMSSRYCEDVSHL